MRRADPRGAATGPFLPWLSVAAFLAGLAACGGGDSVGPGDDGSNGPPVDDEPEPPMAAMCAPVGSTSGWTFTRIGPGTKPAMAVDSEGTVHLAYLNEATSGWVRYQMLASGSASPSPPLDVAQGYFYGPIDLVLAEDGTPHILYHDHGLEDQVLARMEGSAFTLHPMEHEGHDGWYNRGVFGPGGNLHTVTYDPRGFQGDGLEYGVWFGSLWEVELAAPGDFDYAGGTAIVSTSDGVVAAFFDDQAGLPKLARRDGPSDWTVTVLEEKGDRSEVGRFPDMALDPDGSTLHLVYLSRGGSVGDVVRYARGIPGNFEFQNVAPVNDFTIGMAGARDLATLDLDGGGDPVVAIQTRAALEVVRLTGGGVEDVAALEAQDGVSFGQLTEVVVDGEERIHVAWWQSGESPGTVCHGVLE